MKKNNQLKKGTKFLLLVISLYFILGWFDFDLIKNGFLYTFNIFLKIIPILFLLVFINFLINKYFDSKLIVKYLGKESGLKGWILAIISGILVSGPPYILFPLLKDLKKKGMSNALLAVFLYNRNVKIPFLPVMIYYFGFTYTIIVSFYIIIFSIFNGLLINFFLKEKRN
jgi:uncharacterized membrane protein YraQ (UPF0718 family)